MHGKRNSISEILKLLYRVNSYLSRFLIGELHTLIYYPWLPVADTHCIPGTGTPHIQTRKIKTGFYL